ncbi:type II toxin-antitoxin system HipA family toxin YjjJ [Vulcaniibacterium gelatinicum]|uniref:type II toxin-antitoxin system HipA family toxin YjjJ n=1 Tax=Vulcaniibacterium gelatinicum TaxID=2598725 RepID=UPI0011CC2275|nr:type II toxin-antitoxin system HipA family toxin YjjJ [Vulcaniibacterium gelatinicum]
MDDPRLLHLETLLRQRSPQTAAALAAALGVSQPTLSRLIAAAGERIVRIGRARASRYALARAIGRAGTRWPVYRLGPDGRSERVGELRALYGEGFHFAPERPLPAFLAPPFADGRFPGLPWFLDDQRPQGFLGRAFARRVAADIGAPTDLLRWQADDVVLALLRHGSDAPGDLVLGESALQRALQDRLSPPAAIPVEARAQHYAALAETVLHGELVGSSAAGEQPKFTALLRVAEGHHAVIVKFSERTDTPGGRRWADLLACEHLAGEALRAAGLPAAHSALLDADGRRFLQSLRFDRTPALGRRGLVSLAALDAACHGHGRIEWWKYATQLERERWLAAEDAHRLRVLGWFGVLIANSDMHLGNVALHLDDTRPLALCPAYDMLPMHFRPSAGGEVVPREYAVVLPAPEHRDDWHAAARIAHRFWQHAADATMISPAFRAIAAGAAAALTHAIARV